MRVPLAERCLLLTSGLRKLAALAVMCPLAADAGVEVFAGANWYTNARADEKCAWRLINTDLALGIGTLVLATWLRVDAR